MPSSRPSPEQLLAHTGFVTHLARGLLRDVHLAEDVAQDALVAALERPPDSTLHLRAWLGRVTRNFAFQRLRADARRRAREDQVRPSAAQVPVDEIVQREAARSLLVERLLGLPEPMRAALVLRFYEGLPPRTIARRLGVPVETVRTRMKRGLERLRRELEDAVEPTGEGWVRALLPLAAAQPLTSVAIGPPVLLGAAVWPKLAVAAVVVVLGLVVWRGAGGDPTQDAAPKLAVPTADPDQPPARLKEVDGGAVQRSPVGATAASASVAGRVLDPRGGAVAGAMVYASTSGPLDEDLLRLPRGRSKESQGAAPVWGLSDAQGRFVLELEAPGRTHVGVRLSSVPELHPPVEGRWVEAPTEGIDLVLVDAPLAGVVVRARLEETGQALRDFPVVFWSSVTRTYLPRHASGSQLRCELPLGRSGEPAGFQVMIDVEGLEPWSGRVRLERGRWAEVDAALRGGKTARGYVVDQDGAVVADALVFFGLQERLRGDEPFKPFEPGRVPDGARTGVDGRFELTGTGERLTAWHSGYGPVTVASEPFVQGDDERIELPAPGALRGRVVDRARMPRENVLVVLDRSDSRVTDASGRFAFEAVAPGVRGLMLQPSERPDGGSEKPWTVGVEVEPGQEVELELGAERLDVLLEVAAGDEPAIEKGFLLGLDAVAGFHELDLSAGRSTVEGALPGRYLLLDPSGPRAFVTLEGPFAEARRGTADLTVVGSPGARVFLTPEPGNELVDLLCARVSARRIPADGELVFQGLPEGDWAVAAQGRGRLVSARVTGRETRVELP